MSNIQHHLENLQRTFGTREFDAAFAALEADRSMKAADVATVASSFVAPAAKTAPRSQSLERIRQRHENRMDSLNKDAVLSRRG